MDRLPIPASCPAAGTEKTGAVDPTGHQIAPYGLENDIEAVSFGPCQTKIFKPPPQLGFHPRLALSRKAEGGSANLSYSQYTGRPVRFHRSGQPAYRPQHWENVIPIFPLRLGDKDLNPIIIPNKRFGRLRSRNAGSNRQEPNPVRQTCAVAASSGASGLARYCRRVPSAFFLHRNSGFSSSFQPRLARRRIASQ